MIGQVKTEFNILLVEDNPADVRLTQEALKDCDLIKELNVVMDGAEAMSYLRREDGYAGATRPDLILLDLNLPVMSGHEVLEEIKSDPSLALIPVIILTASQAERDIVKSYRLHANCYISKPLHFEEFRDAVQSIERFWCSIVRLPRYAG